LKLLFAELSRAWLKKKPCALLLFPTFRNLITEMKRHPKCARVFLTLAREIQINEIFEAHLSEASWAEIDSACYLIDSKKGVPKRG
jgi:hypothetical protein